MNRQLCFAFVVASIVGICAAFVHGQTVVMAPDVKALLEKANNGDALLNAGSDFAMVTAMASSRITQMRSSGS